MFFNKVTIAGVGLIGASFALALRKNGLSRNIHGYGRSEDNLRQAKGMGIIDSYSTDICSVCKDSDLLVLATPVGRFREIILKLRDSLSKNAIVTDVGSVKGKLVYDLEASMPEGAFYIGSHPIAGSDKSGIADSRPDLFNNALCIITPTEASNKEAIDKVGSIWKAFGARLEFMDPFRHDEIYAAVSHLPHIIAYSIVNTINDIDNRYIEYAGQGFKDATRIALSSPELWRDISIFNKDNLLKMISIFRNNLDAISHCLEKDNESGIEKEFQRAQQLRMRLK